jgi:hypothetical protein
MEVFIYIGAMKSFINNELMLSASYDQLASYHTRFNWDSADSTMFYGNCEEETDLIATFPSEFTYQTSSFTLSSDVVVSADGTSLNLTDGDVYNMTSKVNVTDTNFIIHKDNTIYEDSENQCVQTFNKKPDLPDIFYEIGDGVKEVDLA